MDSRSFVLGAACGAILGVGAVWLLGNDTETEVASEAELEPVAAGVSDLKPVESTAPKDSKAGTGIANPDEPETLSRKENRVDDAVPWPANQWQELELEPKDNSWGYYMEQTLLHFLGNHPSISQFDISRLECRTTRCQVEVIGYDESTAPVWEQVMYDIRQQPWSEFGHAALVNNRWKKMARRLWCCAMTYLSSENHKALKSLEEALWHAETRFDRVWMDRILADNFFEFGRSGRIYNREQILIFSSDSPTLRFHCLSFVRGCFLPILLKLRTTVRLPLKEPVRLRYLEHQFRRLKSAVELANCCPA